MTVDYPPSTELTLSAALSNLEDDLAEAQDRVDELEADENAKQSALAEAHSRVNTLENHRKGLQWAIHGDNSEGGFDGWGENTEIRVTAFTAQSRARTLDTINNKTVGTIGAEETRVWLIAAALDTAPWLDAGDDLEGDYRNTGSLPPALQDWLDSQVEQLNDLSAGN